MSISSKNSGLRFQRGNLKPDQKPRKLSPRERKTSPARTKPPIDKDLIGESEHITSVG